MFDNLVKLGFHPTGLSISIIGEFVVDEAGGFCIAFVAHVLLLQHRRKLRMTLADK
ncbi:hypothetical protein DL95DRAFT_395325, partial [Leptodontidium sp. 2 PMI_412]